MMQKLLTKYWLSLHVAALLLAVWGHAFYESKGWSVSLLWLSFFAVQSFLLLPSVLRGETLGEAQVRSRGKALHDPFMYVGLGLVGVFFLQWLNSGCPLIYRVDIEVWRYSAPPARWLPFSIEAFPALVVLSFVAAGVVGGVLFRNGTGKVSKRFFLDAASLMSGCVALFMVVSGALGNQPYADWGASPSACNWGTCFGFWLLVALGGLLNFMDEPFGKTLVWSLFALLGNLLGVLWFETPIGLALFAVAALLILGYWGFFLAQKTASGSSQLKLVFCLLLAVGLGVGSLAYLSSRDFIKLNNQRLTDASYYEAMFSDRTFQSDLAWKMWQEHPWTGLGAGGFIRYGQTMVDESDWERLDKYDGGISNDWMQFLAEYGVIGTGFFAALVIVLLISLFARLRFVIRLLLIRNANVDWSFSDVDPYVMSGMLAALVVLSASFLLSPFQSGATFVSFVYVLAIVPGFLPVVAGDASKA